MTDQELNEWERSKGIVEVLISKEFGAWLRRRDLNKEEQEKIKKGVRMTEEEIKNIVNLAVKNTLKELRRSGLLKEEVAAYQDASSLLRAYYKNGKNDTQITYAIQNQRFDQYFRIITLYFEQGKTIEQIADILKVDTSTVIRNKKRLSIAIYNDII